MGNSKSHVYLIPIGYDFPEILSDALSEMVSAFLYGQQVHLLAPMKFTPDLLLDDRIDLHDTVLPYVEDPIQVRKYRAQKKKQIEKNNGQPLTIPGELKQMNADIVLSKLHHKLTKDWHGADNAYVIIGLTLRDLCDPMGCQKQIELLERIDRKLESVRDRQRKCATKLRNAMMKGYPKKQKAAQELSKILDIEKDNLIEQKKFEQKKLKKLSKYVTNKTNENHRTSVMSFYRYDPKRDRSSLAVDPGLQADQKVLVKRSCKMIIHHICEMFGMKHCIYFHCRMNGSATNDQQDLSPVHLCPVCLRKLFSCTGIFTTPKVIERYFRMQQCTGGILKECFGEDTSRWFRQRAGTITSAA